jgi:ribosome-associated protein
MDPKKLAQRCREILDDKKAENLLVLDLRNLSSVTDFFVLATASSEPHLRALVDDLVEKLELEFGLSPNARDGTPATHWIVLDYFDVIVHVMRDETRQHYSLESLWGDAPRVRPRRRPSLLATPSPKPRNRRSASTAKTPPPPASTPPAA